MMIRSVLAYAENRLRLDPVPLDEGARDPAILDAALRGLLDDLPDTGVLMNEVMAEDDVNDPYLESYQQLVKDAP